jgi:hypothetical protein
LISKKLNLINSDIFLRETIEIWRINNFKMEKVTEEILLLENVSSSSKKIKRCLGIIE